MELQDFFHEHPKAALGFSGGVDSSYLLWAARQCGADVRPYYIKTAFQPEFEFEDAKRLCREIGAELTVLELDALSDPAVAANPADRCYHCKRNLFGTLAARALADGYTLLLDGTNASDDVGDRPGMRALRELSVRSPLRECGLKNDALLETFYDILIEGLQIHGAYAIYMFYDRYDIPAKTSDKERLGESEEMFPYLICAVCPLVGEYEPGNPICGFLFPAFVDRSGDLERVDIYAERAAWGDRMAGILGAKGRKFSSGL